LSCEEGVRKAKQDFQKGILGYYLYGERIGGEAFDSVLEADYGLKVYLRSCVVAPGWKCYNDFMENRIKQKFKEDVFMKAFQKSRITEYKKHTGVDPVKLKVIDFDDRYQKTYLLIFFQGVYDNDTILDTISMNRNIEIRKNIMSILSEFKIGKSSYPIRLEFDTNGYATNVIAKKIINQKAKDRIIKEFNRNQSIGIYAIEGRKKNFIMTYVE
ncbi:MAG: hypothetical protein JJE25_03985, partial [Bacteroidia bacterium]|nr:hypothetical protein [Bacteroidia bacterium]